MGTISVPVTYTTTATAANLNDCNTTIYNEFNGNIDNDNIKTAAAIVPTKLDLANGVTITQTKTSGNAVTISRNLAAASTDDVVVQITQDHASDDQVAVNIKQDAAGVAALTTNGAIDVTIADTMNDVGLTVTQNDTTNNPCGARITNAGTESGVVITQSATHADSTAPIFIQNSGSPLSGSGYTAAGITINATGASRTAPLIVLASTANQDLIRGGGGKLTYDGKWTDSSDISLKKDIREIEYGLETVEKLLPRSFKMIKGDKPSIGFIAQEIEKVIPEIVYGEEGSKALAYGEITAVLVKAVQELSEKVKELETKLEKRKNAE